MCNLFLLFMVRFHLVDLILLFRLDVRSIITAVVDQFLLHGKIHNVSTDRVHEILRVRGDNKDVIVGGEVGLKPDNGPKIEVVGRLVQKE